MAIHIEKWPCTYQGLVSYVYSMPSPLTGDIELWVCDGKMENAKIPSPIRLSYDCALQLADALQKHAHIIRQ